MPWRPFPGFQEDFCSRGEFEVLAGGAAGPGKMLALDTVIPTASGWTTMGDVRAGDELFDEQGTVCRVFAVHPVNEAPESYRLVFDNGQTIDACGDHLWHTFTARDLAALTRRTSEFRARRRAKRPSRATLSRGAEYAEQLAARNSAQPPAKKSAPRGSVKTTCEIAVTLLTPRGRRNHAVPVADPLDLEAAAFPLDPYLLGVWLGDGTTLNGSITTADEEIVTAFCANGFERGFTTLDHRSRSDTYGFRGLRTALGKAGVFGKKHVPAMYRRGSAEQRLSLLQGLMDTDGTVDKGDGSCNFTTTSLALADGVKDVIGSLGWKCSIRVGAAKYSGKICGRKYGITWTPTAHVFRLERKRKWQQLATRRTTRYHYVTACERIEPVPMRCITVDSPSGLYLAGESYIPTHNTDCLIAMAARRIAKPDYRGLLLRRTAPRYLEILDRTQQLYPQFGAVWKSKDQRWEFPSGAKVRLGHMQYEADKFNYHGGEYQFIGFDELTEFLRSQYMYIFSRMRSARDSEIRSEIRATTNPGGIGHVWVKERFVDVSSPGRTYVDPQTGLSRAFVPGVVQDNVYLMKNDPGYIARLGAMDEIDRQRYLYGNWDIFSGQYFPNLSRSVHCCEPFDIPPEWERFMVLDWGYARPFSVGWYAVDYDGMLYRYREWYGCKDGERNVGLKMVAHEVASKVLDMEGGEKMRVRVADPAIFYPTPKPRKMESRGHSIQDDFASAGVFFLKADNNRELGWQQVHKRFSLDEDIDTDTGEVINQTPRCQVFSTCEGFWRTMPQIYEHHKRVEDVDTDQEDHVADEFRYAVMWRPIKPKRVEQLPEGSFARERQRMLKARRMARTRGISISAAYQRVR